MRRLLMIALAGLAAGCVGTKPRVNPNKPVESTLTVRADRPWQKTGIRVKPGQVIQCAAEGQWSDHFSAYGPEGNPEIYKKHFGVNAPANSLIMQIGGQTNRAYFIGRQTNLIAQSSGEIFFRKNYSLPIGMTGEIKVKVKVGSDADGDGLSDYDEINIWHTNPASVDSDGDGFSDYEEAADAWQRIKPDRR